MQKQKPRVLVVNRESDETRALTTFLERHEFEVVGNADGESGLASLRGRRVDCLLTELRAPRIDGMALLREALERNPEACAVVITEAAGIEQAVEAMRLGALDFQVRPLNLEKLIAVLRRGLSHQTLAARAAELERQLDERFGFESLTGRSSGMTRVADQLRHVASTRATVLIEGEAGTGKGRVAEAIHHNSPRRAGRFVRIGFGALVEGAIEGVLFGDERGAGPEATGERPGCYELADGGTLFLDEIAEASAAVQAKLLKAIGDRGFERVGGSETIRADVRLVAGTRHELEAEVRAGRFREDLYHRLSAVRVRIPALRERPDDMPLLVEVFIREFNREHGRRVTGITRGVLERLSRYPWPGNVGELKNAIEGMVVFASGRRPLDLSDLPDRLRDVETGSPRLGLAVGMRVEEAERQLIAATLQHTGHDKPRAAAMLGIGLRTLYRKIKQYAIH